MINLFVAPGAVFLELVTGEGRIVDELTPEAALEAADALRDLAQQAIDRQAACRADRLLSAAAACP